MPAVQSEIDELRARLAVQQGELEALRAALAARAQERRGPDAGGASQEQTIRALTAKIDALAAERDQVQQSLTALLGSRKWRVVQLAGRLRERLAPAGTRRARWVWAIADMLLRRPQHLRQAWRDTGTPGHDSRGVQATTALGSILEQHPQRLGIVIVPSAVDWGWMRQRPHHLALQFARAGYLVFFCPPQTQTDFVAGFQRQADRLYLCGRTEELTGLDGPVLLLGSPRYADLARHFSRAAIVYDWLDDLRVHSPTLCVTPEMLAQHERLLKDAAVVCTTSRILHEEARKVRADALLCPNGADVAHFQRAQEPLVPRDLQPIVDRGQPIVAYHGALARWFDFELLGEVATRRPQYQFVLIGPDYEGAWREYETRRPPNVSWLGEKRYDDLPAYLHCAAAGMIPFKVNEITRATSPIKLFEYLAAGKPVVTTPLPECGDRAGVLTAADADEFAQRLDEAIGLADDPRQREALRVEARANSWEARFADLHARLAPPGVHSLQRVVAAAERSVGVVVWPRSIDWNVELVQRPHHLARQLARRGYVVVYEGGEGDGACVGFREIEPNLYVFRGPGELLREIPDAVLWCYCYNFEQVDRFPRGARIVYDLIDEPAVHDVDARVTQENHRRALREATRITYVARALERRLADRPDAIYLPNGVDFERFADETPEPPDDERLTALRQTGRPIAGYYGALAKWFDWELLEQVARRRPDWSFVLIGPDYDQTVWQHSMLSCPNVLWLGARAYETLPGYLRTFDVATIPFRVNEITRATSPLKLYEYFAAGKAVITTAMPECAAFAEVQIVGGAEEFAAALDPARARGQDAAYRQRVREIARQNSWARRVRTLEETLARGAMIHLVSFSAVTWNFPLIGRTRMLTEAWQRLGIPTTFVQIPFGRTALERLLPFGRAHESVRVVRPWPTYPRRLWARLSPARLHNSIVRRARGLRRQLDRSIDWDEAAAVVVSPVWAPWLEALPLRRVIYDCIDDLAVHVPRPELFPLYEKWEAELIGRASGAVVTAERLAEGLRRRRPELPVATIRNGVDADRFAKLAADAARPADLPGGGRPIVGFVGAMYEWLDWDLMAQTVRALPEFDFVFVGPYRGRGAIGTLAKLANAHLLGRRPYECVPAYVRAFDVCWVPFKAGDVAAAANPVKIYEYLSLGKGVVSTPVADVHTFGDLLAVAHSADEMVQLLKVAVENRGGRAAARIEFARQNSWRPGHAHSWILQTIFRE